MDRQTDGQAYRWTGRQMDRPTDGQAESDKWTDSQTNVLVSIKELLVPSFQLKVRQFSYTAYMAYCKHGILHTWNTATMAYCIHGILHT
jgi:hypothetical protein